MVEQQISSGKIEAPPLNGKLQWLPLNRVIESKKNPRQYYPEAAMTELVASMKANGFRDWQPLVVRPIPREDGLEQFEQFYEIGIGHRRSCAAAEAGIVIVPCIVREMTDEEFLDLLNFDNSQREDPHPLDESAGWQNWMKETGKGVLDIAAKIGQSKEYVYQRLKYAALIEPGRIAFLNGEISAGHAILIARQQPKEQQKSLKYCLDWRGQPKSVRELAHFIQQEMHLEMDEATFDLDSTDLVPGAGSCTACPKRTKNAPDLIADREFATERFDKDQVGTVDTCTDPSCFQSKLQAHLVQVEAKLQAQGERPLYVSASYNRAKKGGALSRGDYKEVAAGTKGAKTAIVGDGSEAGKVIHVQVTAKPPASKVSPAEEKAAREKAEQKRKADTQREISVRHAILAAIRPKVSILTRADLELLILAAVARSGDLVCRAHGIKFSPHRGPEALAAALPGMPEAEVFQVAVEATVIEELQEWRILDYPATMLYSLARRNKVDAEKIRKDIENRGTSESAPPSDQKPPVVPPPAKKSARKKAVAKKAAKPVAKKKAPAGKKAK